MMTDTQESLLQFPCEFPIKAMGLTQYDIKAIVRDAVKRHVGGASAANLTQRLSKGGKYTSVTVVVHAENREQLDNVYRELSASEEIIMVL